MILPYDTELGKALWHELDRHHGHSIELAHYGVDEYTTVDIAIECTSCGEVILDVDTNQAIRR